MAGKEDMIKKVARYYLFFGPNDYKLNEKISSLIKAVIPAGGEAFDLDRFEGRQCDIADLLNSLSTSPILSPLRVVVLEDVDRMPSKKQTILCEFLPRIPEYSVLAMTAAKADKRLKLFKKLLAEEKKHSFGYKEFTDAEAMGLIAKFAADRDKDIDSRIADMMVGLFGTDPYRLENEVEKLALSVGDKKEIEKKDLAFVSGFTKTETAFDLLELTFGGCIKEALELCGRALASGVSEMQILYIYKNHLTRLNAVYNSKELKDFMATYRVPYPVARQLKAQLGKIGPEAILSGLSHVFRAEYSLKSARFPSRHVIELLVESLYLAVAGNKARE
jgi:DNA polymerase-3 subunit delta